MKDVKNWEAPNLMARGMHTGILYVYLRTYIYSY